MWIYSKKCWNKEGFSSREKSSCEVGIGNKRPCYFCFNDPKNEKIIMTIPDKPKSKNQKYISKILGDKINKMNE